MRPKLSKYLILACVWSPKHKVKPVRVKKKRICIVRIGYVSSVTKLPFVRANTFIIIQIKKERLTSNKLYKCLITLFSKLRIHLKTSGQENVTKGKVLEKISEILVIFESSLDIKSSNYCHHSIFSNKESKLTSYIVCSIFGCNVSEMQPISTSVDWKVYSDWGGQNHHLHSSVV